MMLGRCHRGRGIVGAVTQNIGPREQRGENSQLRFRRANTGRIGAATRYPANP